MMERKKLESRPAICIVTGGIQPPDAHSNRANLPTWAYVASRLSPIVIIARSPDMRIRGYTSEGVRVVLLPTFPSPFTKPTYVTMATLVALWLYRKHRVDLWIADEPLIAGPVTLLLKWVTGRKLMTQVMGDLFDLDSERWGRAKLRIIRWLTQMVARRSDLVRVSSQQIYESAVKHGVPPGRLVYFRNRCDTRLFRFDEDERKRIRGELGLGETTAFITVGTLNGSKGLAYLMDALATLCHEGRSVNWLVLGDGVLRPKLEAKAQELGLSEHVHFLGLQQYDRIPAYLSAADILVQPSMDEGLPRSVLEAMSVGLPVVASAVGGIPEVVRPGETGMLVPRGDPDALAAALRTLDDDPYQRERMGRAGHGVVEQVYSFEKVMPDFVNILRSLMGKGAS